MLSTWVEPVSYGNLDFYYAERLYPRNKGHHWQYKRTRTPANQEANKAYHDAFGVEY